MEPVHPRCVRGLTPAPTAGGGSWNLCTHLVYEEAPALPCSDHHPGVTQGSHHGETPHGALYVLHVTNTLVVEACQAALSPRVVGEWAT